MQKKKLEQARLRLEEKLRALHITPGESAGVIVERSTDRTDEAQAENQESEQIDEWEVRVEIARQINEALERVAAGEYGSCETCGAPIADRRLAAVPWALRCLDCQTRHEELALGDYAQHAAQNGRHFRRLAEQSRDLFDRS